MRFLPYALLFCAVLPVKNAAAESVAAGAAERPVSIGRTLETGGFLLLKDTLNRLNIPFTERSLFADYGAFGTSIVVEIAPKSTPNRNGAAEPAGGTRPAADAAQTAAPEEGAAQGRFILAVPVLSPEFRETGKGGSLSFAHQTAIAFIQKMNEESAAYPDDFNAAVFFLADEWTAGNSADSRIGYAAWLDMLDGSENDTVVYMDCALPPGKTGIYTARGIGRTPYAYTKLMTQTLNDAGIKMFFSSGSRWISALRERIVHDEFDNNTPVLFLQGGVSGNDAPAHSTPYYRPADFAAALYRYAQKALLLHNDKYAGSDDTNYAAFGITRKNFIIQEKIIIVLFLCIYTIYIYIFFLLHKNTKKKTPKRIYKIAAGITVPFFVIVLFLRPLERGGLQPAERGRFSAVPEDGALFVEYSVKPFLEREFFTLTISSSKEPLRFGLSFETTDLDASLLLPFVYESPVPEQWKENIVNFSLGSYPPNPLTLNVSLPKGMYGVFKIEAYGINGSYAETTRSFLP